MFASALTSEQARRATCVAGVPCDGLGRRVRRWLGRGVGRWLGRGVGVVGVGSGVGVGVGSASGSGGCRVGGRTRRARWRRRRGTAAGAAWQSAWLGDPGGDEAPGVGVAVGVGPGADALGRGVDRGVPRGGSEMTVEPPVPVASGRDDPGTDGPDGVAAVLVAPGLGCGVTVGFALPDPAPVDDVSPTAAATADGPGVPMIPSTSPVGVGGQTATARRTIAAIPAAAADVSRSSLSRATGAAVARGNRCTAPTGIRVTPTGTGAGLGASGARPGTPLAHRRRRMRCPAQARARHPNRCHARRPTRRHAGLGGGGHRLPRRPGHPDPVGHLVGRERRRVGHPVDRSVATSSPPTHDPQQHGRRHQADH